MTNVERTNIEACLRNISNLVELKNALELSLSQATSEINHHIAMLGLEEDDIDAIDIPNDNEYCQLGYGFNDIMTRAIENILSCRKLAK